MKYSMRKVIRVIALIIFAIGLASVAYPPAYGEYTKHRDEKLIKEYETEILSLKEENSNQLDLLLEDIYRYNNELFDNGQSELSSIEAYEKSLFELSKYSITSGFFGYIKINRINIELPIYLGATKKNMALGAAHMTYTSIPVDQDNTNAVIVAHRGYRGAKYFRNIDKIKIGDEITVTNPWGILRYEVIETRIIKKTEINEVLICPGQKLLTLSSCHPMYKNTHRYLVIARLLSNDN